MSPILRMKAGSGPTGARGRCVVLGVVALCCLCAVAGVASDGAGSRFDYAMTTWTVKDGLPSGNITAIAQDTDGYLWLGTSEGLARFDGFQFISPARTDTALPGLLIPTLTGARDGSVWVGFDDAEGVSRIKNGHVRNYVARDGLPEGSITTLLEDGEGRVWAGGSGGLASFDGASWSVVRGEMGVPQAPVFSVFEDRSGTLWLGTAEGIFQRAKGERGFRLRDGSSRFVQSFAQDKSGALWVAESRTGVRPLGVGSPADVELPGVTRGVIADRRGHLWVAGLGEGLFRIDLSAPLRPHVERFGDDQSHAARSLFEDREGNLWVGLRGGGLLRLSEASIKTNLRLEGMTGDGVRAIATTPDRSIWIATAHGLNQFAPSSHRAHALEGPILLHTDRAGSLWVTTPQAIGRFVDGRLVPIPAPPGVRLERVVSMTSDAGGALWLCSYDEGVLRWHDGNLTRFGRDTVLHHRRCNFVFNDALDRLWVGFTTGGIAVREHGDFRLYGAADGLATGAVATIYQDRRQSIWVATVNGLTRIDDGKFVTADRRNGLPGKIVPSFIQGTDGELWLGTESGAHFVRFSPTEIDRVAANRSHQIAYTTYDQSDGLLGPLPRLGRPSALLGPKGEIWAFSGGSVAIVDPRRMAVRHNAPAPRVERVAIDGQELTPSEGFVVPPGTQTLQIDYGAISLSSATKLRFRYRLEGFNDAWVDAGTRRQTSYTNLEPGSYRFHVGVTTDGTWTEVSSVPFVIRPPFYRTYWFYGLCILIVSVAAWALWWLRLRTIRNEFALVIAERARVSREIHDTLLQSLGALTVQLEIVSRHLDPTQTKALTAMQRLRNNLVHCIQDARRSVWELRSLRLEQRSLAQALEEMAEETMVALPVLVRVVASGKARQSASDVEQHFLRIAQEAISNAVQHGRAEQITIELVYRSDTLTLSIHDTGCGFQVDDQAATTRDHWGLRNMRERIARLGGDLSVSSTIGKGTVVTAVSPI